MLFSKSDLRNAGGMRKVLSSKKLFLENMALGGLRFLTCHIGTQSSLRLSNLCMSLTLGFSRLTVGKFGELTFLLRVAMGQHQALLWSFQDPPIPTWRSGMRLYVPLKTL
jgi:hypothetical protein